MPDTRTLYIVRHGKSSWDYQSLEDIDRPLKEKGVKDAYTMAERLLKSGPVPRRILSSPAARALHTAIIFSRVMDIKEEMIMISYDLFHADASEIIRIIGRTPGEIDVLMIFGHNPGFTRLANVLSGMSISNIPTCGIVKLVFKTDNWDNIGRLCLVDEKFDFPSDS